MNDDREIRNKESLGGLLTEENADGSPVQEIVEDGEVKAEIHNKESLGGLITEIERGRYACKGSDPRRSDSSRVIALLCLR